MNEDLSFRILEDSRLSPSGGLSTRGSRCLTQARFSGVIPRTDVGMRQEFRMDHSFVRLRGRVSSGDPNADLRLLFAIVN